MVENDAQRLSTKDAEEAWERLFSGVFAFIVANPFRDGSRCYDTIEHNFNLCVVSFGLDNDIYFKGIKQRKIYFRNNKGTKQKTERKMKINEKVKKINERIRNSKFARSRNKKKKRKQKRISRES